MAASPKIRAADLESILGGRTLRHGRRGRAGELHTAVREGLPIRAFENVAEALDLGTAELANLIGIAPRTRARLAAAHQPRVGRRVPACVPRHRARAAPGRSDSPSNPIRNDQLVRVWRLCQTAYAKKALTGDGGRYAPGRWHLQGARVVYASATLSLAALELLARMDRALAPADLAAVEIEIPGSVEIERLPWSKLPAGWDAYSASTATQKLGTSWAASARTAVLEVSSAIVPRENNYVLNPAHPLFRRIRTVETTPFSFDSRLLS